MIWPRLFNTEYTDGINWDKTTEQEFSRQRAQEPGEQEHCHKETIRVCVCACVREWVIRVVIDHMAYDWCQGCRKIQLTESMTQRHHGCGWISFIQQQDLKRGAGFANNKIFLEQRIEPENHDLRPSRLLPISYWSIPQFYRSTSRDGWIAYYKQVDIWLWYLLQTL